MRLVVQGADRTPPLPRCVVCEAAIGPSSSARLVGSRLAHPSCVDRPAAVALVSTSCSVCELGGFAPEELDSSGRCDACRP